MHTPRLQHTRGSGGGGGGSFHSQAINRATGPGAAGWGSTHAHSHEMELKTWVSLAGTTSHSHTHTLHTTAHCRTSPQGHTTQQANSLTWVGAELTVKVREHYRQNITDVSTVSCHGVQQYLLQRIKVSSSSLMQTLSAAQCNVMVIIINITNKNNKVKWSKMINKVLFHIIYHHVLFLFCFHWKTKHNPS